MHTLANHDRWVCFNPDYDLELGLGVAKAQAVPSTREAYDKRNCNAYHLIGRANTNYELRKAGNRPRA
eukprot:10476901-Alexandrium_andersonii.AAC.1